jgi:VIT1/CCC1 family predicted Fe2+/Mn2+ transporter
MSLDPVIRPSTMGFHDGVVSITVMVVSLLTSGATSASVVTPSMAAAFAGAVSMSLGEFSSVSAARDHDIDHESPSRAATTSFASFLLGASIPVLLVANDASVPELVTITGMSIALASWMTGSRVDRTLLVAVVAFTASWMFGKVL